MKPLPLDRVSDDFTLATRLLMSGTACLTAAVIWWDVDVIAGIGVAVGSGAIVMSGLGFAYVRGERR